MIIELYPNPPQKEKQTAKNRALQRFHTACSKAGLTKDEKAAILTSYGVESSKELTIIELIEAAGLIQPRDTQSGDYWRKCVIASIGGWLRLQSNFKEKAQCIDYIKRIAVNASIKELNEITPHTAVNIKEVTNRKGENAANNAAFNLIPIVRLEKIYNRFCTLQNLLT